MDVRFNLSQNSNLSQQLNLAPQLLQWLKILQAPSHQLQEIVNTELARNPALETDSSAADSMPDLPPQQSDIMLKETSFSDTDFEKKFNVLADIDEEWRNENPHNSVSQTEKSSEEEKHDFMFNSLHLGKTLFEHLISQAGCSGISRSDQVVAELLIGCIDKKGYLSVPLHDLSRDTGLPENKLESILQVIQQMDPPGIGARNLQECLLLQLDQSPSCSIARTIIDRFLEPLSRKLYGEIAREIGTDEEHVIAAAGLIKTLNPHPGLRFDFSTPEYIDADVEITEIDGQYEIRLLDQRIPRLRISASCRQMIEKGRLSGEDLAYLKNRVRSASFLIEGIRQREDTLRKVTAQILKFQEDFFRQKNGEIKPLTMAKIGAILKIHETTVSRAIANKHIRTPHGLFPLRDFFIQGYRCADGSALTPDSVKKMIRHLVGDENRSVPLRDVDIASMLKQRGLKVARRTIAKYREELGIPSSKERSTSLHKKPLLHGKIRKLN